MRGALGSLLSRDSRRATGLAALLAAAGFAWLSLFVAPGPYDLLGIIVLASIVTRLAQLAAENHLAKGSLVAIAVLGVAAAVLSIYAPDPARAYLRARGIVASSISVAATVWGNASDSGASRRRVALWTAAAAGAAPLLGSMDVQGVTLLLLVAGSALYLWENEDEADPAPSDSRYLLQTGAVLLIGAALVFAVSSPFLEALVALAGLVLGMVRELLLLLLRPVGYLAEYLVNALQKRISTASEKPLEWVESRSPFEQLLDKIPKWEPTLFTTILEYALVTAVIALVGWMLWRAAKRLEARRSSLGQDRGERDWSGSEALNWAASKGRELIAAMADFARGLLPARAPERPPLVQLYLDFLSAAEQAGCARQGSQTPLEFASAFACALPAAERSIQSISSEFSRLFYSNKDPSGGDLAALRESLDSVRKFAKDDREHALDRNRPVL